MLLHMCYIQKSEFQMSFFTANMVDIRQSHVFWSIKQFFFDTTVLTSTVE